MNSSIVLGSTAPFPASRTFISPSNLGCLLLTSPLPPLLLSPPLPPLPPLLPPPSPSPLVLSAMMRKRPEENKGSASHLSTKRRSTLTTFDGLASTRRADMAPQKEQRRRSNSSYLVAGSDDWQDRATRNKSCATPPGMFLQSRRLARR